MAAPRLNFNRTTVSDPTQAASRSLAAAQSTLSDWQRNNLAQEQLAAQTKQQAFANDLATQQAGIAQTKAANDVTTFQQQQQARQAMMTPTKEALNLDTGEAGMQQFTDAASLVLPKFETQGQKDFGYDAKMADVMKGYEAAKKSGTADQYDVNKRIGNISSAYSAMDNKSLATARDKLFTDVGMEFANVQEAGGKTGLVANKMDDTYTLRRTNELVSQGVDPVKAAAVADREALTYTGPKPTKAQMTANKNAIDNLFKEEKLAQDVVKNKFSQGHTGGTKGGSTRAKNGYNTTLDKAVEDIGFSTDTLSSGDAPINIKTMGVNVLSSPSARAANITEADMAAALYKVTKGEAAKWFSGDPRANQEEWIKEAINISKTKEGDSSSALGGSYAKYNPAYAAEAKQVSDHYGELRSKLSTPTSPDKNDTGLATMLNRLNSTKAMEVPGTTKETTKETKKAEEVANNIQKDLTTSKFTGTAAEPLNLSMDDFSDWFFKNGKKGPTGRVVDTQSNSYKDGRPLPIDMIRIGDNYFKITDYDKILPEGVNDNLAAPVTPTVAVTPVIQGGSNSRATRNIKELPLSVPLPPVRGLTVNEVINHGGGQPGDTAKRQYAAFQNWLNNLAPFEKTGNYNAGAPRNNLK